MRKKNEMEPGQLISFVHGAKLFSSLLPDCRFMGYADDEDVGLIVDCGYVVNSLYYRVLTKGSVHWIPERYLLEVCE